MAESSTDTEVHPALATSRKSMAAVEAGDREGWLALWAHDGVVEDPIGVSMFDATGEGHRGIEAIAAFYDNVIAPNQVRFTIERSHPAGSEVANVGTVTTTLSDGSRAVIDGVFTYKVDDEGRLVALRAYWREDDIRFEPAGG
jgi:ketosteroid isomerase-like protein